VLNDTELPAPLSVQMLLTRQCSTHCAMCTCFKSNKVQGNIRPLPLEQFKALVSDVAGMGTRAITLSGGEPLLSPRVEELLAHCWHERVKVGILTSGVLLLPDDRQSKIRDAVAKHCSWLQVSIDSFDPGILGLSGRIARR
jgi:GTP 3',8-cyclase